MHRVDNRSSIVSVIRLVQCTSEWSSPKGNSFTKILDIPIMRKHPYLSLFIIRLQSHAAPIFFRCSSTRLASASASQVKVDSGVA